jgi:hypothetical protein
MVDRPKKENEIKGNEQKETEKNQLNNNNN